MYWVRRLVLLIVLAIVVGTGYGLVTALSAAWQDGGERPVATPASAEVTAGGSVQEPSPTGSPSESPTSPLPTDPPNPTDPPDSTGPTGSRTEASREPLPEPEGVCPDEDVVVRPSVTDAHVGEPIRVVLEVSTQTTPACTWQVSPGTVFLKISRGGQGDVVWSSQQCPALMPTVQVVARQSQAAEVVVSWSGQMSDEDCSDQARWVLPGNYRAESVARGAVEPLEERFELQEAVREPVTEVPTLSGTPSGTPSESPSESPSETAGSVPDDPAEDPSGGSSDDG